MRLLLWMSWAICMSAFWSVSTACNAQELPREDVVDVEAIGDGFCVSNLFQTGMVLQRDKSISIWGWGDPGAEVTAEFSGAMGSSRIAADRRWVIEFPPMPANSNGQRLTVRSGDVEITLSDILIGDVWILGGQSNMEFELAKVENGSLEIISANYPLIRVLTVPYAQGPKQHLSFPRLHQWSDWSKRHFRKGDWNACTPEIAKELSAIGFVFARRLHQASRVPIGVIDASRGGTTVETWTPMSVLKNIEGSVTRAKLSEFEDSARQWDAKADLSKRIEQHQVWLKRQVEEGKEIPEDRKSPPNDLRPGPIGNHNYPGHCYAGMISPLEGLSIKGAIFHQGYNNAFDGTLGMRLYKEVFPEMIRAWRKTFGDPQMPFGILSLCTDGYPQTLDNYSEKMFNGGIDIRAVQYETFLDFYQSGDENIGFVSTFDLRRRWYHPQLKLPAGERIARWALATEYGFDRNVEWKPPMLISMTPIEGAIELAFDREVGDPLDGAIRGFAISGEMRCFHPAEAEYAERGKNDRGQMQYDRSRLILRSSMVEKPVHFRYAWGRNPLANLQATGHKDLPFATQRSDDWLMEETPLGVLGDDVILPITRSDRGKVMQALRDLDRKRRLQEAKELLQELGDDAGSNK